jgi:hypothetical protein
VFGGVLVIASIGVLLGGIPGFLWLAIGGGLVTARGMRTVSRTRESLRAIAKAKLPPAHVVR